jgi:hypothetical protein
MWEAHKLAQIEAEMIRYKTAVLGIIEEFYAPLER